MISHQAPPPEGGTDEDARPLRFLCTNDDGIDASGLELLIQAAEKLGEVFVVAPDRQRSASSHSLTLHSPIRPTEVSAGRITLDGTPTDCVLIAISELCEHRPDFVLSGVNHGPNMGEDVLYSGTVAAAMEGTILHVPSIAFSFAGRDDDRLAGYADLLERLLRGLVTRDDFPKETFLNINLPDLPADVKSVIAAAGLSNCRVGVDGLRLMQESGLMHYIIPEMDAAVGCGQPGGFHAYDVFEHTLRIVDACPPVLHLRLAALFHDITKPHHKRLTETGATFYSHEITGARVARDVLKRLRYSNDLIKDASLLIERHMFTSDVGLKGLRRFIRRVGQRLLPDLLDLRRADVIAQGMGGTTEDVDEMQQAIRDEIDRKSPFGRSDLAVNGKTIMEIFGLEQSPKIGKVLNYLLEKVLDNPDENTREILLEHTKVYLENKLNTKDIN